MSRSPKFPPDNLRSYLLIKEAAAFLGVSPATLRNWERTGRLAVRRHPINGYRLYDPAQLEEILAKARTSTTPDVREASPQLSVRTEIEELPDA
jgi:MerR family transcriptional regulator, copper efflux regulator